VIRIINLHGDSVKDKDENIFAIQKGVSLFVGIKTTTSENWAKIYYTDLWGLREAKFSALDANAMQFIELTPDLDMAYFMPIEQDEGYNSGVSVEKLFPTNVVGIVTARDSLCIQKSRKDLQSVLRDFQTLDVEHLREQYELGKDVRDWSVAGAKDDVEARDGIITQIAYRPFDNYYTYYTGRSKGFHCMPRGGVMKHLLVNSPTPAGKNFCLVTARSNKTDTCDHFFVSEFITEAKMGERSTQCCIFPLYLHQPELGEDKWEPNLAPVALERLTARMSRRPEPVEVFDYVYGILHDPVYRERFNESLKRDYPRVPVVGGPDAGEGFHVSEEMFGVYVKAGERLRNLHLLRAGDEAPLAIEPANPGDMVIGKIKYADGVLHINAETRILGISEDVWGYCIGGYQVLDKWFKSHKGETLDLDKFMHISKVAGALEGTIAVQAELRAIHGELNDYEFEDIKENNQI